MDTNISKIKAIAEDLMGDCAAHNMDHVMRVYTLAVKLSEWEKIDTEVLQIAALLHDIGWEKEMQDKTGQTDHAVEGANMARGILNELWYSDEKIKHIQACITSHRSKTKVTPQTLEAKLLFDADKMDALWAIGVARHFARIGKNKGHIYKKCDINQYATENLEWGRTTWKIKDKTQHSIQIEYETKLKHLPSRMHTTQAKKLAEQKLAYFKQFLDDLEQDYFF